MSEGLADVMLTVDALAHALALGSDLRLCANLASTLAEDVRTAASAGPDASRFPALERWRRLAIENTARRSPLEVAAAWELTAWQCEAMGQTDRASEAMSQARAQSSQVAA